MTRKAWIFMFVLVAAIAASYVAFAPAGHKPVLPPKSAKIFPRNSPGHKTKVVKKSSNLNNPPSRQEQHYKSGTPLRGATPKTSVTPIAPINSAKGEKLIKGRVTAVDRRSRTVTINQIMTNSSEKVNPKIPLAPGAVIQDPKGNITIEQLRAGEIIELYYTKAGKARAIKVTTK